MQGTALRVCWSEEYKFFSSWSLAFYGEKETPNPSFQGEENRGREVQDDGRHQNFSWGV